MRRRFLTFSASRPQWRQLLRRATGDEAGVTAVEYGLMLAGVALFILVTVFSMGNELDSLFHAVQTKLANSFS